MTLGCREAIYNVGLKPSLTYDFSRGSTRRNRPLLRSKTYFGEHFLPGTPFKVTGVVGIGVGAAVWLGETVLRSTLDSATLPGFKRLRPFLMAHEIAKLLLEHADTLLDRQEAIKTALGLGMPLHEIEEYLDWIDSVRPDVGSRIRDSSADGGNGAETRGQ